MRTAIPISIRLVTLAAIGLAMLVVFIDLLKGTEIWLREAEVLVGIALAACLVYGLASGWLLELGWPGRLAIAAGLLTFIVVASVMNFGSPVAAELGPPPPGASVRAWLNATLAAMVLAAVAAVLVGMKEKTLFKAPLLMALIGSSVLALGAAAGPAGNGNLAWVQDFLRPAH